MRFLLIDDSPQDRAHIMATLAPSWPEATWTTVGRRQEYEAALVLEAPTVILMESFFPWEDGLRVLREIRQQWPALPIVMVTSARHETRALTGLQHGLSDYVLKEWLGRLALTVQASVDKAQLMAELQRTTASLRESQERYQALVEEAQEAIYTHDVEGNFTWINKAAEHLMGYTVAEATQRNIADVVVPEHLPLAHEMIARKLATPHLTTTYALDVITKHGARLSLQVGTQLVTIPGQPVQIRGVARDITAHKRAEILLRQSEARFSTIFHTSPHIIMVTRLADGVCLAVSDRFSQDMGYEREEVLGKSTLDFHLWVSPAQHQHVLQRLQETAEVSNVEAILRTKDGGRIVGLLSASVIQMEGARCVLAVIQNITELKQAEETRAAEARFLQVQTSVAHTALSSLEPDILRPRLLEAVCHAQGYTYGVLWQLDEPGTTATVEAVYGSETTSLLEFQHALQPPEGLLSQVVQTRQPVFWNQLHTHAASTLPLPQAFCGQAMLALPLLDHAQHIMGILLGVETQDPDRFSQRDLSQGAILAHQIAQALENSNLFSQVQRLQEQYRVVSETLYDGVLMVDSSGHIVFANPALGRLTGYTTQELLGQSSLMLYPPEVIPQVAARRQLAWAGQYVSPYVQTQILRKEGQRLAVEMSTANVMLDGRVLGRVAAVRDTSERLRLEAQLRQAQKMQAIGTLAGGIAHDFNNILTAILGFAELTLDEVPQASIAQANLEHVLRAGERAKELIEQLMTFSRQQEQERRPLYLHPLVKEVLAWLRATLPATITLHYRLDELAGPVLADPTQMHQLLLNLCTNAEHAMRRMGGALTVTLDTVTLPDAQVTPPPALTPGAYVRLTVSDTGYGMAPEVAERIFEPFFTTKDVGEGTGLGLAVVHGIVAGHGGAITVESTPARGTTFVVYLPQSSTVVTSPGLPVDTLVLGHEHILFVDDEKTLAHLGKELLTRLGYVVTACSSSSEALKTFCEAPEHFDLLITDQTMPVMTGEALVKAVRQVRPDLPIILCTGFSHIMTEEKALALGVDAFYLKPLLLPSLSQIIRRVLGQRLRTSL